MRTHALQAWNNDILREEFGRFRNQRKLAQRRNGIFLAGRLAVRINQLFYQTLHLLISSRLCVFAREFSSVGRMDVFRLHSAS
jgi:hypothetical protein